MLNKLKIAMPEKSSITKKYTLNCFYVIALT